MTRGCGARDGTGTIMLIGTVSLADAVGVPRPLTVPHNFVGQRPHRMREAGYPNTQDLTPTTPGGTTTQHGACAGTARDTR